MKEKLIEEFLGKLDNLEKTGFTIICNKCKSTDVIKFDNTAMGSEYTGVYGNAGLKCKSCGNALEII